MWNGCLLFSLGSRFFTNSNIYHVGASIFGVNAAETFRQILILTPIKFFTVCFFFFFFFFFQTAPHNSEQSAPPPPPPFFFFFFFFFFCRDHTVQRGPWWPRPRGACCFACKVKSWDAEELFDLITVLRGAHCVLGGDGNYNAHAGLLSCPCGDVFPGASRGDGGGGTAAMKESSIPPADTPGLSH